MFELCKISDEGGKVEGEGKSGVGWGFARGKEGYFVKRKAPRLVFGRATEAVFSFTFHLPAPLGQGNRWGRKRSLREGSRALFAVLQPELFFLSISCCSLRLGRGWVHAHPLHPRVPGAPPPPPVNMSRPWTWASLCGSPPSRSEDPLRGCGILLDGCAACGVSLRAMPRPARLTRCCLLRMGVALPLNPIREMLNNRALSKESEAHHPPSPYDIWALTFAIP